MVDRFSGMRLLRWLFSQPRMCASGILLCDWEHHSHTLFLSMRTSELASILTRNRIEPQHIDLVSFLTTSQKFKFERVNSNSFHMNHSCKQEITTWNWYFFHIRANLTFFCTPFVDVLNTIPYEEIIDWGENHNKYNIYILDCCFDFKSMYV